MTLEVLLEAVRRGERDLRSTPLAGLLSEAFTSDLDLGTRAENVWLAATLIQLKIKHLLPEPPCPVPEQEELPAPKLDRIQLDHAAGFLRGRLTPAVSHDAGQDPSPEPPASPSGLNLLEVARLARVALENARAHQEIEAGMPALVRIEDMIRELEHALERAGEGAVGFDELLAAQPDPGRRVSLFLAVLELVRLARVCINQGEAFSAISLYRSTAIEA